MGGYEFLIQCASALLNSGTAKMKPHASYADLNVDFCANPAFDNPLWSSDEWINYHHTFIWDFVLDKMASGCVRHYPSFNKHARANHSKSLCNNQRTVISGLTYLALWSICWTEY